MSLLLDALKKAEEAKRAAAVREQAAGVSGAGEQAPSSGSPPLMTRDRLPDIAGLELVHDDLALPPRGTAATARPVPDLDSAPSLQFPAPPSAASASAKPEVRRPAARPAEEIAAERMAARQVFEAKQIDYNPKRPYYATLGLLGLLGLGIAGYFWWELQPKSNFVATAPPAPRPVQSAAPAAPETTTPPAAPVGPAPTSAPAAAASGEAAPATAAAGPITGATTSAPPAAISKGASTPASVPAAASAPSATRAPAPAPTRTAALDRGARMQPSGSFAAPTPDASLPTPPQPMVRAARVPAQPPPAAEAAPAERRAPMAIVPSHALDRELETAYGAFEAGDFSAARQAYQQVLRADPTNRDAILGLAAIDVRAGNAGNAEARYQKLLERDPRDPHAQAALTALRPATDPVQSESRIKTLISQQPESAPLQFALGNLLSGQARWSEAQAAYFKAFSADPDNADFAYNLAVSLDHLRQPRLALEYYQRALALSAQRPASFDRNRANARARELER